MGRRLALVVPRILDCCRGSNRPSRLARPANLDRGLCALGLGLAVCLLFGRTLTYGFVYEDWNLSSRWAALAWEPPWNFKLVPRGFSIGLHLWLLSIVGPVPWAFHLLNLSVHLLNVVLLWRVLRRVLDGAGTFFAVAVFALWPVQVEAVSYISALPDLTSTTAVLFGLWALERRYFVVATLSVGLAVYMKEMAAVAFGLLPLWALFRGIKWPRLMIAGWGALTCVGALELLTRFSLRPTWAFFGQALTQATVLLSLIVWPFGRLTIDHDYRWITGALASWIVLGWWLVAAVLPKRWDSPATFAFLWVLIAWAPRFLVPLTEGVHEHHLYLPMIGLCVAFGAWISRTSEIGLETSGLSMSRIGNACNERPATFDCEAGSIASYASRFGIANSRVRV